MKPHWDNLLYSIASGIPNHLFQLNDLVSRVFTAQTPLSSGEVRVKIVLVMDWDFLPQPSTAAGPVVPNGQTHFLTGAPESTQL